MELDTMKNLWQAHEQSLQKMSVLSEQLMCRIINDKSQNSLDKIKNTEYVLGSLTLLFFILFLLMGGQIGNTTEMLISYIVIVAAFTLSLVCGVYKLIFLSGIDMAKGTVTVTFQKINRFHLFIAKERLCSLLSMFIIAPAAYILVFKLVQHKSVWYYMRFSITEIAIAIALGCIFTLILYRRAYLNNLRNILANLKEIEEFQKEV